MLWRCRALCLELVDLLFKAVVVAIWAVVDLVRVGTWVVADLVGTWVVADLVGTWVVVDLAKVAADSARVVVDSARVVAGSVKRVALGMVPMVYKLVQS